MRGVAAQQPVLQLSFDCPQLARGGFPLPFQFGRPVDFRRRVGLAGGRLGRPGQRAQVGDQVAQVAGGRGHAGQQLAQVVAPRFPHLPYGVERGQDQVGLFFRHVQNQHGDQVVGRGFRAQVSVDQLQTTAAGFAGQHGVDIAQRLQRGRQGLALFRRVFAPIVVGRQQVAGADPVKADNPVADRRRGRGSVSSSATPAFHVLRFPFRHGVSFDPPLHFAPGGGGVAKIKSSQKSASCARGPRAVKVARVGPPGGGRFRGVFGPVSDPFSGLFSGRFAGRFRGGLVADGAADSRGPTGRPGADCKPTAGDLGRAGSQPGGRSVPSPRCNR